MNREERALSMLVSPLLIIQCGFGFGCERVAKGGNTVSFFFLSWSFACWLIACRKFDVQNQQRDKSTARGNRH